jgi:hypothetical protein
MHLFGDLLLFALVTTFFMYFVNVVVIIGLMWYESIIVVTVLMLVQLEPLVFLESLVCIYSLVSMAINVYSWKLTSCKTNSIGFRVCYDACFIPLASL